MKVGDARIRKRSTIAKEESSFWRCDRIQTKLDESVMIGPYLLTFRPKNPVCFQTFSEPFDLSMRPDSHRHEKQFYNVRHFNPSNIRKIPKCSWRKVLDFGRICSPQPDFRGARYYLKQEAKTRLCETAFRKRLLASTTWTPQWQKLSSSMEQASSPDKAYNKVSIIAEPLDGF